MRGKELTQEQLSSGNKLATTKRDARAAAGLGNIGRTAKFGAYAYFPGSGPAGMTCRKCSSCVQIGKTDSYPGFPTCAKWHELRGGKGEHGRIDPATAACKYFVERDQPE